jgi:hypothetical protein
MSIKKEEVESVRGHRVNKGSSHKIDLRFFNARKHNSHI